MEIHREGELGSVPDDLVLVVDVEPGPRFRLAEVGGCPDDLLRSLSGLSEALGAPGQTSTDLVHERTSGGGTTFVLRMPR